MLSIQESKASVSFSASQASRWRDELGIDMPRGECIDSDVLRSKLAGHAARHLKHCGLAGIV